MRIALLCDVYHPVVNGVVHHVALLKRHLEQLGQSVWLFVPGNPGDSDDCPYPPTDELNVIRYPGIPLAGTGYHLSLPFDRRVHHALASMDVIHAHHPFVSGSLGAVAAGRYGIPLVFTNHTRYDLYVRQYAGAYLPFIPRSVVDSALQSYFRRFSVRCAAQIAPSAGVVEHMRGWGVNGPIRVIPNGIEAGRFVSADRSVTRQMLGLPSQAVVGVFMGRLSAEKRVRFLLDSFAQVAKRQADVHLLVVGDGPQLAECRRLVDELGMANRVTFTGAVAYDRIPDYLAMGNFFVSASVSEVHPLSFMEAAAAGLPLLGIRSPGVCDIVDHRNCGLLAGDDSEFVNLLQEIIGMTPQSRQMMGHSAQDLSVRWSASTTAKHVFALYRELATENDVRRSGTLLNEVVQDPKK